MLDCTRSKSSPACALFPPRAAIARPLIPFLQGLVGSLSESPTISGSRNSRALDLRARTVGHRLPGRLVFPGGRDGSSDQGSTRLSLIFHCPESDSVGCVLFRCPRSSISRRYPISSDRQSSSQSWTTPRGNSRPTSYRCSARSLCALRRLFSPSQVRHFSFGPFTLRASCLYARTTSHPPATATAVDGLSREVFVSRGYGVSGYVPPSVDPYRCALRVPFQVLPRKFCAYLSLLSLRWSAMRKPWPCWRPFHHFIFLRHRSLGELLLSLGFGNPV